MTTPHINDTSGREAFRKELIAEVKRLGGQINDTASIEEAKQQLAFHAREGNFPQPVRVAADHARRAAADAHTDDSARKPAAATKRKP